MHAFNGSREHVERDPRNDPRTRTNADDEVVIDRQPIVADRSRDENEWPVAHADRRRSERRRIERMGTDI
jgi:hypothetical protein